MGVQDELLLAEGGIDVEAMVAAVATEEHGAVCTFLGTARRHSEGREVRLLAYQAFAPMADRVIREILSEAGSRFGAAVLARHRLGDCPLGEASVAVVAAAAHRDAAFGACRYVIDELKSRVPIWKREDFVDGTAWVGDPAHPAGPGPVARRGETEVDPSA